MDQNGARPHGRHFNDRMAETGCSKHRPKVCLSAIKAARRYHEAMAQAEADRVRLIDVAIRKAPDRWAALGALNHLADSFGLPPFTFAEVAAAAGPGT
ncbi:MAG TPA: hypothetical protein VH120_06495 [Gemmataceae bacterium]|jgi:hypothetical protein|nr:hypothetical protein [Gemmataceae bacterium]